jgi:hypothetical protein
VRNVDSVASPDALANLPQQPSCEPAAADDTRLKISVINGNIQFIHEPLLLGHYRDASLTGAEGIVDGLIGGALSTSIRLGRYPQHLGSQQVFVNAGFRSPDPFQLPRPAGVIVVGLGSEGQLRAGDLEATVRLGVIAWSQSLAEIRERSGEPFVLAATLIGSGGTGIAAGQAARLVAEGVRDANLRLARAKWPCVCHLRLVELYMDRSTDAWRSLKLLDAANPGCYLIGDAVIDGLGGLKRPLDSSYRGTDYDLISAVTQIDSDGETNIVYTLDTRRARTEVRATAAQGRLLAQLVKSASSADNADPTIGQVLYQLIVPREMRPFLAGGTEMQIEVDRGTAGIPWEMLDTAPASASAFAQQATPAVEPTPPWAIRAKLLRKLRVDNVPPRVDDASRDAQILVIGEPFIDDPRYPALPGAWAEARAVADIVEAARDATCVRELFARTADDRGPDARTVISTLLERDWRMLHIAGHGEPPADGDHPVDAGADRRRGVVLSDGIFLGPREIGMLQRTPELVFVNCCYLAARSGDQLLKPAAVTTYDRPRYAANVAEALISLGVKCVIAAGWAVEDDPAKLFATTFYQQIFAGQRFLDAVYEARRAAWMNGRGGNTWAAYQCYGDANWTLEPASDGIGVRTWSPRERYAGIASSGSLVLALEELTANASFDASASSNPLAWLDDAFGERWSAQGEVAEAFGKAWAARRDDAKAVEWFRKAVGQGGRCTTFGATEQLASLQAKRAWTDLQAKVANAAQGAVSPDDIAAARAQIDDSLRLLRLLLGVQQSVDRLAICGGVHKRMALVERVAGNGAGESDAIGNMLDMYRQAEELGKTQGATDEFYPLINRLAAELMVRMSEAGPASLDAGAVERLRQLLDRLQRDDPNFWNVAAMTELTFYESLAQRNLGARLGVIRHALELLHTRMPAPSNWSSVLDQCEFVLGRYVSQPSTSDDEKAAAVQLLTLLRGWSACTRS